MEEHLRHPSALNVFNNKSSDTVYLVNTNMNVLISET